MAYKQTAVGEYFTLRIERVAAHRRNAIAVRVTDKNRMEFR
jgi:hypothetical protein